MPLLLAAALTAAQFGPQGPMKLPKGGTIPKSYRLAVPLEKRPRVALFPLFFDLKMGNALKAEAQKGFLDGALVAEKSTKAFQFVGTKMLFEKAKGVNDVDPAGQWLNGALTPFLAQLKVDYFGAISIQRYVHMVGKEEGGWMVLGLVALREAKTNKPVGGFLTMGVAAAKPGGKEPTLRDAVYDMVANRVVSPTTNTDEVVR